jgi:cob(I)alamin adenosyltransferase
MRKAKSTRPGDKGITSLPKEAGVSKASLQVAAIGDVDELSAALGVAAALAPANLKRIIERIQRDLFEVGADISEAKGSPMLSMSRVRWLEREIQRLQEGLPPLRRFIVPGGSQLAAALHLARAICRRAERSAVAVVEQKALNPAALAYLNRLSTLMFAMARAANARAGVSEEEWAPRSR